MDLATLKRSEARRELINTREIDPQVDPIVGLAASHALDAAEFCRQAEDFGAWCKKLRKLLLSLPQIPARPTGALYTSGAAVPDELWSELSDECTEIRDAVKSGVERWDRLRAELEAAHVLHMRTTRMIDLPEHVFAFSLQYLWPHTSRRQLTARCVVLAARAVGLDPAGGTKSPERRWRRFMRRAREGHSLDPADPTTVSVVNLPMYTTLVDHRGTGTRIIPVGRLVEHLVRGNNLDR